MMGNIEIIRSKRRSIAVEIRSDLRVVVRAPMRMKNKDIQRFIEEKSAWIEKHLEIAKARQAERPPAFTDEQIRGFADAAVIDIPRRVERFSAQMGVSVGRVTIRSQKTRWGSCSAKGNLNFNCLLMLCPEDVRDYVVVHELSHRKEFNHSPRFWEQVEQVLPDYRERRRWLKKNGSAIIGGLR